MVVNGPDGVDHAVDGDWIVTAPGKPAKIVKPDVFESEYTQVPGGAPATQWKAPPPTPEKEPTKLFDTGERDKPVVAQKPAPEHHDPEWVKPDADVEHPAMDLTA